MVLSNRLILRLAAVIMRCCNIFTVCRSSAVSYSTQNQIALALPSYWKNRDVLYCLAAPSLLSATSMIWITVASAICSNWRAIRIFYLPLGVEVHSSRSIQGRSVRFFSFFMPLSLPKIRADAALRTALGLVRPACTMRGHSFICVVSGGLCRSPITPSF